MINLIRQNRNFFVFLLVGGICTVLHTTIVIGLVELFNVLPTLANLVAFIVANIASYLLNSILTFDKPRSLAGYCRFLSLSMTMLIAVVLTTGAGDWLGISYLIPLLIAVTVVPVISFALMKQFAFR